jgi:hypothetical protein
MLEVRVPIQENQAVAASPPESQQGAQNNAAVSAQHHRQPVCLERGLGYIGQGPGYFGNAIGVEDAGGPVTPAVIRGHRHVLRIVAAQEGMQASGAKHLRGQLHAVRAES